MLNGDLARCHDLIMRLLPPEVKHFLSTTMIFFRRVL
jgi:hypothetical protein